MSKKNILNRRIDAQLSPRVDKNGKKKKRKEHSMPPKDKEEAKRILDAAWQKNPTLCLCFSMQALTGLRYSDCSWLMYSDFFDEKGRFKKSFQICQQKSYRIRMSQKDKEVDADTAFRKSLVTIYNNPAIREIVEDCKHLNKNSDLLFPNNRSRIIDEDGTVIDRPMSVKSADYHLKKIKDELNLDFELGTHSWRKFFALMLLRDNTPIEQIRDLLGHDNIVSTNSYLHTFAEDLLEHTKKLRLD
jgi:integrase